MSSTEYAKDDGTPVTTDESEPTMGPLPAELMTPDLLRTLFERPPSHVYLFDSAKRYRFANAPALEALGLGRDDLIGKTWQEAGLSPSALRSFESDLDAVLAGGETHRGKTEYPTVFGPEAYEYAIHPLRGYDRTGDGALALVWHISDVDEDAAERNLAELESIYALAPIGLAVFDTELRFMRVNERLAEINGFSPEEHLGRVAWDLVPDLQEVADPMFRQVLESGEGLYDMELKGETPANPGVERTWIEHYVPLKSHDGRVIGINAVVDEVTERRAAELALAQAQRQIEATLTATDIGLWRWDVERDEFVGDRNLRRLFGFDVGEEKSSTLEPVTEKVHPDDRGRVLESVEQALAGKGDYDEEYRVVWPDGSVRWIHARGVVEFDDQSRPVQFPGVVLDVTERKRAEEALHSLNRDLEKRVRERTAELREASDELQTFLYSASHDLKSPLRGIDGFSKILLDEHGAALDASAHAYLRRIRTGAQRIGELIDGLLQLSKLSQAEVRRTSVDLTTLAEAVASDLRTQEPEREVTLVIEPNLRANADAGMTRLLLKLVIENAWTFTRRSEAPRIEVGTVDHEGTPHFMVRDNGIGFDNEYADKLFLPFQTLHSPGGLAGGGIGLALAKRIVRRHLGSIWGEGKEGEGATIYFTLGRPPQG